MNVNFFDYLILGILAFSILMFLTGNGDKLMDLFGGKGNDFISEYNREKLDRASLIFCIFLFVDELLMIFLGSKYPPVSILALVLTIIAFVAYVFYIKKYAKK